MLNSLFISEVNIDWRKIPEDSYLHTINSIKNLKQLIFRKPITFFTGENGSGKSTLLEAIAVAYGLNPEGGSKDFNFHTKDTHSELCNAVTLYKGCKRVKDTFFLRAESFYNVASIAEEYSMGEPSFFDRYGGTSLHEQSHGESFLNLISERFSSNSLYILDEPEAALSPQRQLSVLSQIYHLSQKGTQFIIASHSPILLGTPNSEILSFDGNNITPIDYLSTESYKITELFINHKDFLLNQLL